MTSYAREHRDSIAVLLSRVQRGVQSELEGELLRTHIEHLLVQIDTTEAALTALHQGEEPHLDEYTEPTPAQWIWHWNRATPEQRLDAAARALAAFTAESACFLGNHKAEAEYRQAAQATLARVRKLASDWAVLRTHGGAAYELLAALNQQKEN